MERDPGASSRNGGTRHGSDMLSSAAVSRRRSRASPGFCPINSSARSRQATRSGEKGPRRQGGHVEVLPVRLDELNCMSRR